MDKTESYSFFLWLLILLSFACGSDVVIEVGPVEYGKSVTLKCVLHPPFIAERVTWTKVVGNTTITVATYTSHSGAEISEGYKDRLWMSTLGLNETAITVHKTSIQDEGCYRCTFNSLPKESPSGRTCLTIPGGVLIEKHHRVRFLQPVTMRCIKRTKSDDKEEKIIQISWQKNDKNIATYTNKANIEPEDREVLSVTMEEPLNVTVWKDHDTGCLKITCVARSWPRSVISWVDVEEGSLNGTTYDGFLTVTSWILIRSPDAQQMKMPKCKVNYLAEESIAAVSAGSRCGLHPVIISLLLSTMIFIYIPKCTENVVCRQLEK